MNHLPSNEIRCVLLSKMQINTLTHRHYIGEWKRTFAVVSNEVRYFHYLHDPSVAAIYGPLNNRVIQNTTFISNVSDFESIHFLVKGKPVTVTRGLFPLLINFDLDNYVTSYNYFFNNGLHSKKCKQATCSLYGSTAFGCNHPYLF